MRTSAIITLIAVLILAGCSEKSKTTSTTDTSKTNKPVDINSVQITKQDSVKNPVKDALTNQTDKSDKTLKQPEGIEKSPVEGKYSVGTTSCVILNRSKVYKVVWADGEERTLLFKEGPEKDFLIFEEHASEKDNTPIAKFLFKDWSFKTGTYRTADGKEQPVERKN